MALQFKHLILYIIASAYIFALSYQQLIQIKENVNYVSHNVTGCRQSLLEDKDNVIFESSIDISGMFYSLDCVEYQIKNAGEDYQPLCFLNLKKCQTDTSIRCYCRSTEEKDVFKVIINITAKAHNCEAILRGRLSFLDRDVFSNEQRFPAIYEPLKEKVFFYINNIQMDTSQCNLLLNNSFVVLVFHVIDQLNLPCELKIKDSQTGHHIEINSTSLSHVAHVKGNNTFIMSYKYCGLTSYYNSFACKIEITKTPLRNRDDVESFIAINNDVMDATNCKIQLINSDIDIVFYVNDQIKNKPCQITIKDNQTGHYLQKNSTILSYTAVVSMNSSFILTYEMCGLTQSNQSFTCIIEIQAVNHINDNLHDLSSSIMFVQTTANLVFLLFLVISGISLYIAWKTKILKWKCDILQEMLQAQRNRIFNYCCNHSGKSENKDPSDYQRCPVNQVNNPTPLEKLEIDPETNAAMSKM